MIDSIELSFISYHIYRHHVFTTFPLHIHISIFCRFSQKLKIFVAIRSKDFRDFRANLFYGLQNWEINSGYVSP